RRVGVDRHVVAPRRVGERGGPGFDVVEQLLEQPDLCLPIHRGLLDERPPEEALPFRRTALLDRMRHSLDNQRQCAHRSLDRMTSFPLNPLTDGMAWSGFDRAAARLPGGAAAVFRAIGVPLSIVDRPGMQASFRQYVAYFEVMARRSRDAD